MSRPRSLRTTLLLGLVVLNLAVIGGITSTVYARAHRDAHDALQDRLRLRAKTLAQALELGDEGIEFEVAPSMMPDYEKPGSGSYAAIYDTDGKAIVRSPSLADGDLPRSTPWVEEAYVYGELEAGPDGIPCTLVTHSFVARVEDEADDEWEPPSGDALHYQILVAEDSRPRDTGLLSFLGFLGLIGGGAVAVTILGGVLVARYVLRPIGRMTDEAAELTPEDTSRRLRPETVVKELNGLSETLNSALDRLGDALDRQRRFTSDASHELRTPLSVLLGNAELLLRRPRTTTEYQRGLERQRRIAARMTKITENLLSLARADDGHVQIEVEPVELPALARSVVDELEPMAEEGGIALELNTNGPVRVEGDATHLSGLLQNLISNAVKFTPEGGSVRVSVHRENGHAVVDVADTGPGIAQEHREQIFDRFYRVNEGRDRREGAGLGLAIVNWIVRAHEGRISVENRSEGGARFTVELPVADED